MIKKMRCKCIFYLLLFALILALNPGAAPEAALVHAAQATLEDGEYTAEVTLAGGSGRASVASPAVLTVENGTVWAQIEWDSSHYDYMKIDDTTYLPINESGNSTFRIPVAVFDEPVTVIADTTAMSVPHEIEYTLTFSSSSVSPAGLSLNTGAVIGAVCAAAAVLCVLFVLFRFKRRRSGK